LQDDFEACITHLRFPLAHRRAIRTINLLERLFGEERRRTKVIPHAFGERAVLKLMYAALIRAAERWRGLHMIEFDRIGAAEVPHGASGANRMMATSMTRALRYRLRQARHVHAFDASPLLTPADNFSIVLTVLPRLSM
jgi:hypothetical protein